MTFALGQTSMGRLQGVHPSLVAVVTLAITYSTQDFTVQEGLRSLEQQKAYVAAGHSWTLASKHLMQTDGFGHAVDLVPWVSGKPIWSWPLAYPIMVAVRRAAIEKSVTVTWGAVWDRHLKDLSPDALGLKHDVEAYCARHPGPDKLDAPHVELA